MACNKVIVLILWSTNLHEKTISAQIIKKWPLMESLNFIVIFTRTHYDLHSSPPTIKNVRF